MRIPAFIAILACSGAMSDAPAPAGLWTGTYGTGEGNGELAVRIEAEGDAWSIQVRATSSYVSNPQFLRAADPRVSGDTVQFTLVWGSPVRWTGVLRADTLEGTMSSDHWSGTWRTTRKN